MFQNIGIGSPINIIWIHTEDTKDISLSNVGLDKECAECDQ